MFQLWFYVATGQITNWIHDVNCYTTCKQHEGISQALVKSQIQRNQFQFQNTEWTHAILCEHITR